MKGNENIISKNILAYGGKSIIRSACVSASDTIIARFISKNNLIWNTGDGVLQVEKPSDYSKPSEYYSIEYWVSATSNDKNSIVKEPELLSPVDFDFTPKKGSIACDFGIDFNLFKNAGPRNFKEDPIEERNAANLLKLKEGPNE